MIMNYIPQISTFNTSLQEFIAKNEFMSSSLCPVSKSEFNWLFRQRRNNGFNKAFVRISARLFLVHVPTFIDCLSERLGK